MAATLKLGSNIILKSGNRSLFLPVVGEPVSFG